MSNDKPARKSLVFCGIFREARVHIPYKKVAVNNVSPFFWEGKSAQNEPFFTSIQEWCRCVLYAQKTFHAWKGTATHLKLTKQKVTLKIQLRSYNLLWKWWSLARTSFARSEFRVWIRIPHTRRHNNDQRPRWCVRGSNRWAHCWGWWSTLTLMFILDSTLLAFFKV